MTSKWLKRLAVIMALCMTIGMTACNREVEDSSSETSSGTSDVNEQPRKVGYIFHGSGEDSSFSAEMNVQRVKASNRSGMETCYIDNVRISDFESAVKQLISVGCTEIVSGSPIFANALSSLSNKYMNINFISYGVLSGPANVAPYSELIYQGAYAAGMMAAFNSEAEKIGFIGDMDMTYTIASVNAAALGLRDVFTTGMLYAATATQDAEIEEAIDTLLDKGCDVIICYTGSAHSEDYCQQKGVKFIGSHDYKGKEDSYSNMLMYYCARRDSYFLAQFKQMQLETWMPEAYVGDVGNGTIHISDALNEAANNDTQKIIDALKPKLTSGDVYIFNGEIKDNSGAVKLFHTDMMSDSEILNMEWFVDGVESSGDFRKMLTELPPNSFEVKS